MCALRTSKHTEQLRHTGGRGAGADSGAEPMAEAQSLSGAEW